MLVSMISAKALVKFILPLIFLGSIGSCKDAAEEEKEDYSDWQSLTVMASAYNSLERQGEGDPKITAWGDTLRPEVPSIAVSRDLMKRGLSYGTPVKIEGFDELFVVNDKMHSRWKNKIDIYMGQNRKKALEWGRRKVTILFPDLPQVEP